MTTEQKRAAWRKEAEWLKEHQCSLRDGTDLSKLTSEERIERAAQIQFESRIISTATGNNCRGKAGNFTRKFA